jgi:hypothetical protein
MDDDILKGTANKKLDGAWSTHVPPVDDQLDPPAHPDAPVNLPRLPVLPLLEIGLRSLCLLLASPPPLPQGTRVVISTR